jgi:hypothetical protein
MSYWYLAPLILDTQRLSFIGGRHGRNSMVVGFTATYMISVYH